MINNEQTALNVLNTEAEYTYVFVYGSLRKPLYNYKRFLSKCEHITTARISGFKLYELCSSYPGAVYTDSEDDVLTVEAFSVSRSKLRELDALEGHPTFYKRIKISVDLDEDQTIKGWIYCIPEKSVESCPVIESGDWVEHKTV